MSPFARLFARAARFGAPIARCSGAPVLRCSGAPVLRSKQQFANAVKACAALSFLLLSALPATAQTIYNGHTYLLTNTVLSWTNAEAQAISLGGHLVTINNASEQSFLNTAFNTSPIPLWIGMNDAVTEGNFVWSSGEPVTYTNWNPDEPNGGRSENYVAMNWQAALNVQFFEPFTVGDWNDTPVGGTAGYGGNTNGLYRGVVELPFVATVPEMGTLALLGFALMPVGFALARPHTGTVRRK